MHEYALRVEAPEEEKCRRSRRHGSVQELAVPHEANSF